MAKSRIDLHAELRALLGSDQVYFRAPDSVKMRYPAIVYTRSGFKTRFADSRIYRKDREWTITLIYRDPDSDLPEKLLNLPYCRFDRHYVADNLNHDIFTLIY